MGHGPNQYSGGPFEDRSLLRAQIGIVDNGQALQAADLSSPFPSSGPHFVNQAALDATLFRYEVDIRCCGGSFYQFHPAFHDAPLMSA